MKRFASLLGAFLVILATALLVYSGVRYPWSRGVARSVHKTTYQCAMHPQIVSDRPGNCPICQMTLSPVEAGHEASAAPAERRVVFYRHPMRPDVTSPQPAKDEMGMDYIPVYADEVADAKSSGAIEGHAGFSLSPERQQLIGVTKAAVERRDLASEIRAVGKVAYDPELYRAINEYQEALRARHELDGSQWEEAKRGADSIIRSSKLKLRQLGIGDQQMRELGEAQRDPVNLLLPGKSVWVYVQVYEYEAELVKPGQKLVLTSPSAPGRVFEAKVTSIDSMFNAATRTVRVRALVATPDANLRPETFVHARIHVPIGNVLALPESAVLDTGDHQTVFVVDDRGRFDPRSVQLGREAQGYYEVLAGVEAGEQVVTSANFFIDSESRFRAAALSASQKQKAHVEP